MPPSSSPERRIGPALGYGLYAALVLSVFGIALSNAFLLLSLVFLPWTVRDGWARLRPAKLLLAGVGVYLLMLGVAIAFSYSPAISWEAHSELFNLAPIPLAILLVRGERDVRRIFDGLILVGGIVSLYALSQLPAGFGDWEGLVDVNQRIRGPFSHYMTLAGFLLLCDLLLIAVMLWGEGWKRPWRWGALVLLNLTLLVNQSRNAWVALVVVGTGMLLARNRKLLLAYAPLAVLLLILAPAPLVDRIVSVADLEDPSNYDRLCMWDAGLHMIAQRPITGIGPEMVEERYSIYRPPTAPRYQRPHLHNLFLQIAAERGLPALASYLALMGLAFLGAWRGYRSASEASGPRRLQIDLHIGVLAALVAFNLSGLFENNWGDTEVQRVLLFLMAVPFCLMAGEPELLAGEPEARC